MRKVLAALIFSLIFSPAFAQSKEERDKAYALGLDAVKKIDAGEYEEALELWKRSSKLDPANPVYSYETGYTFFLMKKYPEAIAAIEPVLDHKDANDQYFQMTGTAYHALGQHNKALEIYERGLQKFPGSGRLYVESGAVEYARKKYDEAIAHWEKGVQEDPRYASSYYWLSKVFCNSEDRVWGLIYGEIFMNLEKGTKRTSEISKLLYETYVKSIKFESMKFTERRDTASVEDTSGTTVINIPFPQQYESNMRSGIAMALENSKVKDVSQQLISNVRSAFIDNWFGKRLDKDYSNVLFDYQRRIQDRGHFEAYNRWLLMKGNEPEYAAWIKEHGQEYDAFISWYKNNPLQVNERNKFYRGQYQ